MEPVAISTLTPGTAFEMPWRNQHRYGKVLDVGNYSVGVYVREPGHGSWETTRWSRTARVIPITPAQFYTESREQTERNRSSVDSPVERVHAICKELGVDTAKKPAQVKAVRDKVIKKCLEEGINISTAKTQYYAFRKKH